MIKLFRDWIVGTTVCMALLSGCASKVDPLVQEKMPGTDQVDARISSPDTAPSASDRPVTPPTTGDSQIALADGGDTNPSSTDVLDSRPAGPDAIPRLDAFPAAEMEGTNNILPVLWLTVGGKAITQTTNTPGTLKVIEGHDGTVTKISDVNLLGGQITLTSSLTVALHGATSLSLPKKSYAIQLDDGMGTSKKMPLVGLPQGSDWVLHSCGQDHTCMRNALSYAIGRDMGRYNPRTRFTELFLDGKYQGIYVVVEKIKQDKERVDIPKPADTAAAGDITGGYIFKQDLGQGTPMDKIPKDWVSSTPMHQMVYSYVYPQYSKITTEQRAYLKTVMDKFEQMMNAAGWDDPVTGYPSQIGVASWVDFALFQEMVNNIDAYQKSLYIQKLPDSLGGKLELGPLWDYDYAYGVATFRDGNLTDGVWAFNMNKFGTEPVAYTPPTTVPHVPFFWEKLWKDAAFQRAAKCRWMALRTGPFALSNFEAKISAFLKEVSLAEPRDAKKWPDNITTGKTYAYEVDTLRTWITKRLAWIDGNLPGTCK